MSTANPDLPCAHEHFDVNADVNRMVEPDATMPSAYMLELTIECGQCGESFRFTGVKGGLSFAQPMCSPDETELRAPIRPASSDDDFGLGLPGFAIGLAQGPAL